MANDLEEHFERLRWCRDEIVAIKKDFKAFMATKPYKIYQRAVPPPENADIDIIAELSEAIPKRFSIKIGTTCNELRAILDALASVLAIRNGKSTNGTYFPIAKQEDDFRNDKTLRNKISKIGAAEQLILQSLKPWPGGNDLLVSLHQADVTRKHIRLIAMLGTLGTIGLDNCDRALIFPEFNKDMSKGVVVARLPPGASIEFNIYPTMSFSSPPYLAGKDVFHILDGFTKQVELALRAFD